MLRLVLGRLAGGVVVILAVATFSFFMLKMAPGGPFDDERRMAPEIENNIEKRYHLDEPLLVQYGIYMTGLLTELDLGHSMKRTETVWEIVGRSFPVSAQLGLLALGFAIVGGVLFGVVAAVRHNTWVDHSLMAVALFGISVPAFVLGPILIAVFAIQLMWLPPVRFEGLSSMILPAVTLGMIFMGVIARLARSGLLETMRQDYIRTARSKGLSQRAVVQKHAVRLGLVPVVTYLGPAVAALITGSFVVELIFQIPGLGWYFVASITDRDYPVLSGVLIFYSGFIVILNLAVDISYGLLDPRDQGAAMTIAIAFVLVQGLVLLVGGAAGTWLQGGTEGATYALAVGLASVVGAGVRLACRPRQPRHASLWNDAWRRLKKNRMAVTCAAITYFVAIFSFLGPTLARALLGLDATSQDVVLRAVPPSWEHWMGTDQLGRDVMVRTMVGGQIAIAVGVISTAVALIIGVTWGAVAGYVGGKVDEVMMRFVDVMYAFPTVVFVIVVMAMLDTRSIVVLFALIGGIRWLNMARIVRGQVLSLRHREFIEAARCLGVPTRHILFRHIIPNTLGIIIVYSTLSLPSVMLTEAFLSFLGLGVQAPLASWGTLVSEGRQLMALHSWVLVGPGLVMGMTIFALNFLGDGLRDALDPQMRKD